MYLLEGVDVPKIKGDTYGYIVIEYVPSLLEALDECNTRFDLLFDMNVSREVDK